MEKWWKGGVVALYSRTESPGDYLTTLLMRGNVDDGIKRQCAAAASIKCSGVPFHIKTM